MVCSLFILCDAGFGSEYIKKGTVSDEGLRRTILSVGRIGYHASGHNFKGKRDLLDDESDLGVMYSMHTSSPYPEHIVQQNMCGEFDSNNDSLSQVPSTNIVSSLPPTTNVPPTASLPL